MHANSVGLRPEVLVYDTTGKTILNFADPSATGNNASLTLPGGTSYQIVVTSQDENDSGFFSITVGTTLFTLPTTTVANTTTLAAAAVAATPPVTTPSKGTTGLGAPTFIPLVVSIPTINLVTTPTLPAQARPTLI